MTTELWDFDHGMEVEAQVTVLPLVRTPFQGEDYLAARLEFELLSDEGALDLSHVLMSHTEQPAEVRIVDPVTLEIQMTAVSSDGEQPLDFYGLDEEYILPGQRASWIAYFGDTGFDETAMLLPYFGLVEDIEVVDPEDLEDELREGYHMLEDLEHPPERLEARTYPGDVYRERDGGEVSIRDDDGQATLTMDSDVLFDIDEHELDDDADAALQAAAEELERLEGGELFIIGHTDDVLDEDYNQALSERRAESVQDRLDELTDLSVFDVTVEGRNFQEPVADNSTEEGRAQNRRVELKFELPEMEDLSDLESIGSIPDPEGPVGGADDVLVVGAEDGREAEISVEEVYQAGNLLVGRLSVEITENAQGHDSSGVLAWPFSFGADEAREDQDALGQGGQADALTLLIGDSRVFPLEMSGRGFLVGVDDDGGFIVEDLPWYAPMADAYFGGGQGAAEGVRGTVTVLWPLVSSEEVTIDVPVETEHGSREGYDPWRFEEVPVDG
ncbi:OmpA family protein [Nesterenkonia sp. PF2B19]|uniref:OmpA family protein n=2 Tax=Bacteria TaxID=2 RepID=UPI000A19CA87|nr:OmpA family protein [Nesterenkonia sp. PF2B19]OSM43736.1 hypothetical protein BCY76_006415 [Nesterenkonia sp. PF2B19]